MGSTTWILGAREPDFARSSDPNVLLLGAQPSLPDEINAGRQIALAHPIDAINLKGTSPEVKQGGVLKLSAGGSIGAAANGVDTVYTYASGDTIHLLPGLYYGFLATTSKEVLLRIPYGHNTGYRMDDHGSFWLPRAELSRLFFFTTAIALPDSLLSPAATPHVPQ